MRLHAPITSKLVGDVDGLRADVVDKILGTAERKRSHPTTSLDVKVDRVKQTIPPSRKQQQQQTTTTQSSTSQRTNTAPKNRSRRGGIPPSFDFSQLEGLTEEQLRLALANDPELAAAATAAGQEFFQKTQKRKSPYYRNKDGHVKSINDYPAHLRSMMEDGIPVKQWIILLILLGVGLYQLKNNMFTTKVVEKNHKKIASTKKASRKVGIKKGKRVIVSGGPAAAVQEKDAVQSVVPDEKPPPPLQEEELDKGKETPTTDSKKTKALKKKQKPTSKKVQPDKTTKDESRTAVQEKSRPSPDMDSEERDMLGHVEPHSQELLGNSNDDEWQTVGKGSAIEKSQIDNNGNQVKDSTLDPITNDSVDDVTNATSIPDDVLLENATATAAVKPTKRKKNKNANDSKSAAAQPEDDFTIQDDEALAMKLQQQEEKLAEVDSRPISEDIWASVTPKKSKRSKGHSETAAGTETSLA